MGASLLRLVAGAADGKGPAVLELGVTPFISYSTLVTCLFLFLLSTYQTPFAMPPSDFANADINGIIDKLSVEEAVKLIAGAGSWHTVAIERLGIPAIKVRLFSHRRVYVV